MNRSTKPRLSCLFRSVDIASLAWFRIVFGLLGVGDVAYYFVVYHLGEGLYDAGRIRFAYRAFEWVSPLPGVWMSLFFVGLMWSAFAVAIGWRYHLHAALFAVGSLYLFVQEKSLYLNHGYFLLWLAFAMIFLPAGRAWSVDAWRRPVRRSAVTPYWCLFSLQALMGIVYLFGGIAKLNPDWLRGMPLQMWLEHKTGIPVIGPLFEFELTAWVMSYGGLCLDLFVVPLLIWRRTRLLALAGLLFFHLLNTVLWNIGIFPWLSLALSLLYFDPAWPRMVWGWIRRRAVMPSDLVSFDGWQSRAPWHAPVLAVLLLCGSIHVLVPLRHHLFTGDVAWTEEGHRYSWRMMLRTKRGGGHFEVLNPATGERLVVSADDYQLVRRQRIKLHTTPDLMLQFAHMLKRDYAEMIPDAKVYAVMRAYLNDHELQPIVDPTVDLASVSWEPFAASSWILPHVRAGEAGETQSETPAEPN